MRKFYLKVKDIYKIDKLAAKKYLIPSSILMENAGREAAKFIDILLKKRKMRKVLILCGPGKNGGDGFVIGRYLHIWGYKVKIILLALPKKYKGDTLLNYKILKKLNVKILKYNKEKTKKIINDSNAIVDAIFGIGLNRKVDGIYEEVISLVNNSNKIVFSVDIPSGLNADTGDVFGTAIKASFTLTMGFYKAGYISQKSYPYIGKLILLDIGYPKNLYKDIN
ncbi:MAG: NAD(P)H-hydrate epimerase [Endomicrobia bacterium]|nr:NAD(P)H-hydrate epimerase [Endomicrobiia bacterium]